MKDAKLFLQQVRVMDLIINAKIEELSNMHSMITKITPSLSDAPGGSGSQDKLGDAIAKIVDLENEINEEIDSYVEKRRAVSNLLLKIKDPNQFAVLHSRYMGNKSFEQIAFEMHMTYRNVCYLHGKGLQAVKDILKKGSVPDAKAEPNANET